MYSRLGSAISLVLVLSSPSLAQPYSNTSVFDVFQYVNQFIGTLNGGNVFAGASLPYGMAKAVADVSGQNTAGFASDGSNVTGFSTMHDSGTGGNPSLGNFPLFPQFCLDDVLDNCKFPKYARAVNYVGDSVKGNPGYFSLSLANGISAEMTTTQHTGLYRFSLPQGGTGNGSAGPLMLLDLTDLSDSRQNATVSVSDDGRIKGNGTFIPSFGSGSYVLHFCADFNGAAVRDTGMWVNDRAGTEPKELFVTRGINLFYLNAGSWARFQAPSNGVLNARMGMSFVSSDQACQNAESEIPDWDFDRVRSEAETAWREKLSPVTVEQGPASDAQLTTFYSGLYRIFLNPQDYTNENPLWQSTEPYFDSFYCIWDSFRTQFPLLTILDPSTYSRMLRSLLDTYSHLGYLPDCRMSLCKGFTQGGSNADVVFADAYVKDVTGVDYNLAYTALVNDAENEPLDWSNEGRGGLQSWKSLDYIPALDYDYLGFGTNSRSISRTLEYAYNDFAVAAIGRGLGRDDYTTYLARSGNWRNLFKADQRSIVNGTDSGFVGFFQPKYLNGTWGFQDPSDCGPLDGFCSLTSNPKETFEANIWEYQFYVPQSIASLISLLGGPVSFVSRLQYLIGPSGEFDISNEIAFLPPYLFHYAGRPGLSASTVRSLVNTYFDSTQAPAGLPGNDDSGAGGSWVAWSMMGLFPIAGQDVYLINPPFFDAVTITNSLTNTTSTIRNIGSGGNGSTGGNGTANANLYIQSATLNGQSYTRNWISHGEFFGSGNDTVLELTVGATESDWGTGMGDLPPSEGGGNSTVTTTSSKSSGRRGMGVRREGAVEFDMTV